MLKALRSSSCLQQARLTTRASYLNSPFHGVFRSVLGHKTPKLVQRVFFCSDSSDSAGSDAASAIEEAESKSTDAIVPTAIKKPHEFLTVLALPLPHRPLFPGFYMPIYVKDPKLLAALVESRKRQAPYAGAFLVKDDPGSEGAGLDPEKNIYELKGKELLNRLHDVGTLAQITSIHGDQVVLIGHRRC